MIRSALGATLVLTSALTPAVAQKSPADQKAHALHGLLAMYAAGTVCSYEKLSFSKQDTDEMLARIKVLGREVPQKVNDDMWNQARDIMAEGQATANAERCAAVRNQYAAGRPFLLGLQPMEP